MKKYYTLVLFLALFLSFFGCEVSNLNKEESKLLDFQEFKAVGEMHNFFLTEAQNNFNPPHDLETYEEKLAYFKEFSIKTISKFDIAESQKEVLLAQVDTYNRFVDREFIRTTINKELAPATLKGTHVANAEEFDIHKQIEDLHNSNLIDNFEYESSILLLDAIKDAHDNKITNSNLDSLVDRIIIDWKSQGYTEDSKHGTYLAYILSISESSLEWWEIESTATKGGENIILGLPAVAAYDVAGAIVGAGHQLVITGGDAGWMTAGAALLGGAAASSGVVGKIASWFM